MSGKMKHGQKILSKKEIEEIKILDNNGWTVSELSRKFDRHRTTILHHLEMLARSKNRRKAGQKPKSPHYKGIIKKVETLRIMCNFCGDMFDRMDYKINRGNNFCSTKCAQAHGRLQKAKNTETEEQKLLKKQTQCEHKMFMVKCSLCGKCIGSELSYKSK